MKADYHQPVRVCLSGDGWGHFEEMELSECVKRIYSEGPESDFIQALCRMALGLVRWYHTANYKDAPAGHNVYESKVHRSCFWRRAPKIGQDWGDTLQAYDRYKEQIDILGGTVMWNDVIIEGETLAHALARAIALEYASKQWDYGIPEHHVEKAE